MSAALKQAIQNHGGIRLYLEELDSEDFSDVNLNRPATTPMQAERQVLAILKHLNRIAPAWSEDAVEVFLDGFVICGVCRANPKYDHCCEDRLG